MDYYHIVSKQLHIWLKECYFSNIIIEILIIICNLISKDYKLLNKNIMLFICYHIPFK